jgi:hypothetical protein
MGSTKDRDGVPLLPNEAGRLVTLELVNALREDVSIVDGSPREDNDPLFPSPLAGEGVAAGDG